MPKPKEKQNNNSEEIKIKVKEKKSNVSEFVKRELPNEEEVEKFDDYAREEAKSEDIEESLTEIYQDEKGKVVDVKKLDIKKGKGFFFYFFSLVFLGLLAAGVYSAYIYYYKNNPASAKVEFSITAKEDIISGEEFYYTVSYKNLSGIQVNNAEIKLVYPSNFIYMDATPAPQDKNDTWRFEKLDAHRSDEIKIKGKIINKQGEANNILGVMTYTPANFSSEFKKETAFENNISGTGLAVAISQSTGVLAGEENEISIKYKKDGENFINSFRLTAEKSDNIEFLPKEDKTPETGVWQINEIKNEDQEIKFKFKVKDKKNEKEELIFSFEATNDGNTYYEFREDKISFDVIKNSLNLNLILNGARNDQGIDFGQTLNYSLAYANKGDAEMKDVVIMAVLNSGILDWKTLSDKNTGTVGNNTISWTKEQIKQLESLQPGAEGIIDFSINVLPLEEIKIDSSAKYEIESYGQFSIGNTEVKQNEDMKSNTIICKINSDLKFEEQVRYFSEDNIAVGSGPLPPKAGQTTSYKVYWKVTNNLHELNNLRLETVLPAYVNWDNKNRTTAGGINYDESARKVIWEIGRLPVSVYEATAEFNISITPADGDKGKILVLLSGTTAQAVDNETGSTIAKAGKAKTTKLEDDSIAEGDGRVE